MTEYVITPKSDPVVGVGFGSTSTIVNLTYELDVKTQSDKISTLRTFTVNVDVPFKKAYDEAAAIIKGAHNVNQPFFEGLTLELITLESAGAEDHEPIPPPFGGSELSNNPGPYWTLAQTKAVLQQAIENSVNNVQVLGSKDMDYVSTSDPLTNNYYSNYYFSVPAQDPSVAVNFLYVQSWDPYVAVHPCSSGAATCQIIKPNFVSMKFPFIPGLKQKTFQYDVSYPVLTQIRVPEKSGDELLFQFPFEVNLRNNNALDYDAIPAQEPDFSFCDPDIASGTQADISVVDQDGQIVSASVRYSCIANSCGLGDAIGGHLQAQLPVCVGGKLEASRDGYRDASIDLDSQPGQSAAPRLVLERKTAVDVAARGVFVQRTATYNNPTSIGYTWTLADSDFAIDAPQRALLVLTPRDHPDDTQVLSFPDDTPGAHRIKLYPGVYDITAVALELPSEPKIVHGGHICYDTEPLNPFGGQECTDIPDITLGASTYTDENGEVQDTGVSEIYVGGFDYNEGTRDVTITQDMLDSGRLSFKIPMVYLPDVQQIDDTRNDMEVFDKLPALANQLEIG
jgi:hypothetical protein